MPEDPNSARPGDAKLLSSLKDALAGEPELLKELIDIFLHDTPEALDEIREALAAGDTPGIHARAHKMRGSAMQLDAEDLADVLAVLENKAAVTGPAGELQELIAQVEFEFHRIRALLEREAAPPTA